MQSEDRYLVRRCLSGDRSAFDTLYDRHAARVYHLLRRLTAHEAEAEDLTQEAFLAAYRDLASWRGEGSFGTWLCGIAFHQYTQARRRPSLHTEPFDEATDRPYPDADPLAHCLRRERQEWIDSAIVALSPIYREVFVLVSVQGLSYREAAQWLGVPLGTVQWRLWRAVRLLQAALRDLLEMAEDDRPGPARSNPRPRRHKKSAVPTVPEAPQASGGGEPSAVSDGA